MAAGRFRFLRTGRGVVMTLERAVKMEEGEKIGRDPEGLRKIIQRMKDRQAVGVGSAREGEGAVFMVDVGIHQFPGDRSGRREREWIEKFGKRRRASAGEEILQPAMPASVFVGDMSPELPRDDAGHLRCGTRESTRA